MDAAFVYELIGYIASLLIAVSLTMRSILRLRVINLAGAVFFTAYGLAIRAYPVAAVNAFIVLVDLYYLWEIRRSREYFDLLEVTPDSRYLANFLKFYAGEIERFQPGFRYQPVGDELALFVLRNMVPAGLFIGRLGSDGCLQVQLDFVIPGYRDFRIADFVFRQHGAWFRQRGIRRICSQPGAARHEYYLRRMGFDRGAEGYCLEI